MSSRSTCLPAGKLTRLRLRIRPAAPPSSALGAVVGFSGETGFDAEVIVLDLVVSPFSGVEGSAVVDQIILEFFGQLRRVPWVGCGFFRDLFVGEPKVSKFYRWPLLDASLQLSHQLHHGRLSSRDYRDALGVLLGAQTIDAFTAGLQKRLGKLLHRRSPHLTRIERVDNSEAYRIPPEMDKTELNDVMQASLIIEKGLAGLAAELGSNSQIDAINKTVQAMGDCIARNESGLDASRHKTSRSGGNSLRTTFVQWTLAWHYSAARAGNNHPQPRRQ